jgi:hypothetical protein
MEQPLARRFYLSAIVDEDMLDSRVLQNNARTSGGALRR